ncbi:hypothetical protein [Actinoplanes derwentensis]|uniref:Uncharacterized protein n=1 Tax=Actinoplanes derwentensis TaxID=113562 RepID=A0A1H1RJX4_9ACTN|nr:hypothetical protein [Actinoplanes derwentensis]GID84445.1 hypothetical protein Ade03nite_33690 [Actinoplanes derwentensis]SDS36044.1 hypothetical protein SAMN04489716_0611 [Actinoplanes derwentensis]
MTDITNPPLDTDDALWDVIRGIELLDIRVIRWHGELHDYQANAVGDLYPDFSVEFRNDSETLQLRWDFDTTLRSPTSKPVADLGLTLIQEFTFTDPETGISISPELIHEFAKKTAIISIIPFVREAVQTLTVRLGLPPVTLGLMRAGSAGPQSFSVRGTS